MRVELGSTVRTSDGKDIGTIDKLIIDPRTGDVKSAVVRKGMILPDDVQIPLEWLEAGVGGEAWVDRTADQIDKLPRFVEADYTEPPTGYVPPYGYPAASLYWPVGYYWPPYPAEPRAGVSREVREFLRKQDLENAVVDEGSEVKGPDGDKVGEVHSLLFDADTGELKRIIVRKGFWFSRDLELPASVIAAVDDGVVYLNVDKDQVEQIARSVGR